MQLLISIVPLVSLEWVEDQVYKFLGEDMDHSDEIVACLTLEGAALEKFVKVGFAT